MASILLMMVILGWVMGVSLNTSRRLATVAETSRNEVIADLELEIERRTELESRLLYLAEFDGLTGIRNRRSFLETAQAALADARRGGRTAAVLLVDLDHFKRVNDTFGHARGDAVLRDVARQLRDLETDDIAVGRVGGEEFAVVCTGHDRRAAVDLAEGFRVSIAVANAADRSDDDAVTVSVGVCTDAGSDLAAALHCADSALYDAKGAGRNQVAVRSFLTPDSAGVATPVVG
jgi:diguanylate cyclase (GGDEF)-like protein